MAVTEIDNRGLVPPEPMVRILSALAKLDDGDEIVALMDRDPKLLYRELERRGFEWELADGAGGYRLTIRRAQNT